MAAPLREIPLDDEHWDWGGAGPAPAEHLGRACIAFVDGFGVAMARDIDLGDGVIELELAVGRERSFHGVVWHLLDEENYESFFVRPHQVGNPDAVQYTPVYNDDLGVAALPRAWLLGADRVPARAVVHDPRRLRRWPGRGLRRRPRRAGARDRRAEDGAGVGTRRDPRRRARPPCGALRLRSRCGSRPSHCRPRSGAPE